MRQNAPDAVAVLMRPNRAVECTIEYGCFRQGAGADGGFDDVCAIRNDRTQIGAICVCNGPLTWPERGSSCKMRVRLCVRRFVIPGRGATNVCAHNANNNRKHLRECAQKRSGPNRVRKRITNES